LQDYLARTDMSMTTFADEFECGRELGSGQFATVYLAVHLKTNVPCAIKVIGKKEDGGEGELFKMEAEVC
jgi:serine/threonine protein kinase